MKNDLSNTEIAPVTTLPESVRIPLHSLQADLGYLIGRVIADGSCGPMIITSMRERLDQIETAVLVLALAVPASADPTDYSVTNPDTGFPTDDQ